MNFEVLNITAAQVGAMVVEGSEKVTIMGVVEPVVITAIFKNNKLIVTYYSHAVKEHVLYAGITNEPEKVISGIMTMLL